VARRRPQTTAGSATTIRSEHRILVNACLMRRRSLDRHPTVAIDSLLPEFDATGHHRKSVKSFRGLPNDFLATEELRQQVRDCIDRLPATYREVLTLRDIEEFDTDATAAALGVTPGVVKTRLHRARQALRLYWSRFRNKCRSCGRRRPIFLDGRTSACEICRKTSAGGCRSRDSEPFFGRGGPPDRGRCG
jgi:RNA polymerase sigma factor (sigma-70 family)